MRDSTVKNQFYSSQSWHRVYLLHGVFLEHKLINAWVIVNTRSAIHNNNHMHVPATLVTLVSQTGLPDGATGYVPLFACFKVELSAVECEVELSAVECVVELSAVECEVELSAVECVVELSAVECEVELSAVECEVELSAVECEVELSAVEWEVELSAVECEVELSAVECEVELSFVIDSCHLNYSSPPHLSLSSFPYLPFLPLPLLGVTLYILDSGSGGQLNKSAWAMHACGWRRKKRLMYSRLNCRNL